jgi:hypothetical protein
MPPIRRIALFKHGMACFEREGSIRENQSVELAFKERDMNDALKSLVVLDLDGGVIASVSFEGADEAARAADEIGLELQPDNALAGLLQKLAGAPMKLRLAGREIVGVSLGLDRVERRAAQETIVERRLAFRLSDGRLASYPLFDIEEVELLEARANQDLDRALASNLYSRKRELRRLTIFTRGVGERRLFVSYVIEAPVWKTSYRMILGEGERRLLQGWALVDNTHDEDWTDVQLSLVAGLPVSFVHDLYSPRYRQRPEIRVETEAAYGAPLLEAALAPPMEMEELASFGDYAGVAAAPPAPAAQPAKRASRQMAAAQSAQATTRRVETGDFYAYDIDHPVTVKRGETALVPILSAPFEGERVAVYNESIREKNPMASLRFRNSTSLTLEGGPVTLYEGDDYLGEAMLDTTRPGEERLLPFAVELGCRIAKDHKSERGQVFRSVLVQQQLTLHCWTVDRTIYRIDNSANERALELLLDHPITPGADLIAPAAAHETTESRYRFKLSIPAHGSLNFEVALRRRDYVYYGLMQLDEGQFQEFRQTGLIDAASETRIRELYAVQGRIVALEDERRRVQEEYALLADGQKRVRDNLKALGEHADERQLRTRYVRQLDEEETRLAELKRSLAEFETQLKSLERDKAARLQQLSMDIAPPGSV